MARGGVAKITETANDVVHFYADAGGWGSSYTRIREITLRKSNGTGITSTTSATEGSSVTINRPGTFLIIYNDQSTTDTRYHGISLNTTSPSTDFLSISASEQLAYAEGRLGSGVISYGSAIWIGRLDSGDVVRPHTQGTDFQNGSAQPISFFVARVGL